MMFEHILVPLDGSPLAECVLPHVVALAQVFHAQVTLLRVLERFARDQTEPFVDPLNWHISEAEAKAYLDGVASRLDDAGLQAECVLLEGQPAGQVIEFARGGETDLIILSSHGRSGLSGWNVSSIVQKIILRAYVSTMIVRAYQPAAEALTGLTYQRMLVPVDGSHRAECVLPLAAAVARFQETQLVLAHIVRRPEMPRRVPPADEDVELVNRVTERNYQEAQAYLEQVCTQWPAITETRLLVSESVTAALHELVEQEHVDLVLLSAHGYSADPRWPYGSIAISFIAYGSTPLLIVQDVEREAAVPSQAELAAKEHKGH
jgi:nucleotide-binding universal stress UspA family protein